MLNFKIIPCHGDVAGPPVKRGCFLDKTVPECQDAIFLSFSTEPVHSSEEMTARFTAIHGEAVALQIYFHLYKDNQEKFLRFLSTAKMLTLLITVVHERSFIEPLFN